MVAKTKEYTKLILLICSLLFLGFLLFDLFSMIGIDYLTYLYIVFMIPILSVLLITSLVVLFRNKIFCLRNWIPIISILVLAIIMPIILCITPGTVPSHEIQLYYLKREIFNCPLPSNSELILKGGLHANSTGRSNHCENLAYIAIYSSNSKDEIKSYYENKLKNKIDSDNYCISIYLFDKDSEDPFIDDFPVFSFTDEQINQLVNVGEYKKTVYLISIVYSNKVTCIIGS